MSDRFQILALDGGGIKGLFSAAVLAHVEEDLGVNIADHFDLIAGTSTGGIIALALGLGMKPREIVEFYVNKGPSIFAQRPLGGFRHLIKAKHDSTILESAVKSCYRDKLLADSQKRLVIPAYNIGEDDVYLFRTPHHERLARDLKVPVWKIAMATSAAPTYLSAFTQVDHQRLVDGGVWANNPTMVAIAEAVSVLGISLSDIKVLNLGTTCPVKGRHRRLDHGGKLQWATEAVDVILRGQSIGAYNQARLLLGNEKVVRLDPVVPDGLFDLDKVSTPELLAKAAHESRIFVPLFRSEFSDHTAPEFTPCVGRQGAQQ